MFVPRSYMAPSLLQFGILFLPVSRRLFSISKSIATRSESVNPFLTAFSWNSPFIISSVFTLVVGISVQPT